LQPRDTARDIATMVPIFKAFSRFSALRSGMLGVITTQIVRSFRDFPMKTSVCSRDAQQAALFGATFAEWGKDADRAFDYWLARRGVSCSRVKIYGFM